IDEVKDVDAAWGWLASRGDVPMGHVALLGLSMGAAAAINAAEDLPVRAVVDDSGFATLENIASHSITHFTHLPKYPFGPLAVFFASRLVLEGGSDDIALPDADGRAVFDAAPPGSQWLLEPKAYHVGSHGADPAGYEAKVIAFLDADVAPPP